MMASARADRLEVEAKGDGPGPRRRAARRAFTLFEVMTVVAIIGAFAMFAVPSFRRAVERSHADFAAASLQCVWVAQRYHHLDHGSYAADLATLEAEQLIENTIRLATRPYAFAITTADAATFTATATRVGSTVWSGTLSIDQDGRIQGVVGDADGTTIAPGYLFTEGQP
jgi:type IV pilus assembly protein PilE